MIVDTNVAAIAGYQTLFLSKNRIEINAEPADISITDRSKLRYTIELVVQPFYNATEDNFISLPIMEAIEEPVETIGGASLFKGAYFEVSAILHSILEANLPPIGLNKILLNPSVVRSFYYNTRIFNAGEQINFHQTTQVQVFRGGVNEKQADGWVNGFNQRLFTDFFKFGNDYLTYSPVTKILPNQPQFLSVLVNQIPTPTQLKLRVSAEYTDGTYDASPITVSQIASQECSVYTIPVGPTQLGLNVREKPVKSYFVWLTNQLDQIVYLPRVFEIDYDSYIDVRFIIFRNSLSVPETLACVGKVAESISITREAYTRTRAFGAPATYTEKVINQVTAERRISVNTGWLTSAERNWLEELAISEEVALVTEQGYLPLTLVDNEYLSHETDETLIGRTFNFVYNNPERNFSALPPPPPEVEQETAWRAYNYGACQLDSFGKRTGYQIITHLELYYTLTELSVKPARIKLNTPDTEGYLIPQFTSACLVDNYLNEALSQPATYRKNDCTEGYQGSFPTLSIDASIYGSESSQAAANAKALAVMLLNNTQAYADEFGACDIAPWAYDDVTVPAGRINIRWAMNIFNASVMFAGGPGAFTGLGSDESWGTHWMVYSSYHSSSQYYAPANNTDYLVKPFGTDTPGYFIDTPKAGTYNVYLNGGGFFSRTVTLAEIAAAGGYLRFTITNSHTWVEYDKVYIQVVI